MMTTEAQLAQTIEQIERMARVLMILKADVLPKSRFQFALMAEGPLEELRRLEQQVSACVEEALDAYEATHLKDEEADAA